MPISQAQRRERQHYLCASELPIILGLSPYNRTESDVYFSKIYDVPEDDQPADHLTTGNLLEDPLLTWAARELGGVELERQPWFVCQDGPAAGIIAAHPDAVIVGRPEGMEAKYANSAMGQSYGDEGTDAIPDHVVVQAQTQMLAARLTRVWVPVAIAGFSLDFRLYSVPRDDDLIGMIVRRGLEWWEKHVVAKVPPHTFICHTCGKAFYGLPDALCCPDPKCASTAIEAFGAEPPPMEILKNVRREPQSIIDLTANPDVERLVFEWQQASFRQKEAKDEYEELKAKILHLLGAAEGGLLSDGRMLTFLEQSSAPVTDTVLLRAKYPAAHAECITQGKHRVLRVKEPKKPKGAGIVELTRQE